MDEKTAELRDLFLETTGAETVTEGQEESPGSLTARDESAVESRLAELIETMCDRYDFRTDLDVGAYARVARGHFTEDESDAEMAADLDVGAETVRTARFDLHLVAGADREAPFEYDRLKRLVTEGDEVDVLAGPSENGTDADPVAAFATELGVDAETVRRYLPVACADLASTRANHRFRDEFRDLLTDAEIEGAYAADARDDGLREATEDIETDVSL